jgi:formylglycine-generating enzyme required for sulfatase activity
MANDNEDPMDIEKTVVQTVSERKGYTLAVGLSLGQYRIVRPLGRGGMGEVYEAEHTTLGRRYALKLLPADFDRSPEALDRFRREARVMANLEHPNIIRVDDFGEADGRYWLRMELAEGLSPSEVGDRRAEADGSEDGRIVTLADLAEAYGGRLPQETLLPILRQVLQALDYAHGRGAVHRDLKPGNILLTAGTREKRGAVSAVVETCTAKISDFGLVKLIGEEWMQSMVKLSVQRSMSMGDARTIGVGSDPEGSSTRSMLGTYEYMSPEQKRGEEADARSDLYAVGLMCYRLLTGRANVLKLPSRIDAELFPAWDDFVEQALEEEPGQRLQSAKEGLRLLEKVEKGLEGVRQKERQGKESFSHGDPERKITDEPLDLKKAEIERAAGDVQMVDLGGGVKLELVWCPPGTFMMGSPLSEARRNSDEMQHRVTLTKGFWMGKYEVTQAQWEAVMGNNPSLFMDADKNAPVERVSWNDCQTFVRKLNERIPGGGFRLPTEAEWEYACRAGTATASHYGDDLDATMANFDGRYPYGDGRKGKYRGTTVRVGSFRPNAWGLYDMHGNVWEWCEDGCEAYPSGSVTDPVGHGSDPFRVVRRGGSWYDFARNCRSANRSRSDPGNRISNLGLRLARDPQ